MYTRQNLSAYMFTRLVMILATPFILSLKYTKYNLLKQNIKREYCMTCASFIVKKNVGQCIHTHTLR